MRLTALSLLVVFILVSVINAQPDPFARGVHSDDKMKTKEDPISDDIEPPEEPETDNKDKVQPYKSSVLKKHQDYEPYKPNTYKPYVTKPYTYKSYTRKPYTYKPYTYKTRTYKPNTYKPYTYKTRTYKPNTYKPYTYKTRTYKPYTYKPYTYKPQTYQPY